MGAELFTSPTEEQIAQFNGDLQSFLGEEKVVRLLGFGFTGAVFELSNGELIKFYYSDIEPKDFFRECRNNEISALESLSHTEIAGQSIPKYLGSGEFDQTFTCGDRPFKHWLKMTRLPGTSCQDKAVLEQDEAWLDKFAPSLAEALHELHGNSKGTGGPAFMQADVFTERLFGSPEQLSGFEEYREFLYQDFLGLYRSKKPEDSSIVHYEIHLNFQNVLTDDDGRITGLVDFGSCCRTFAEFDCIHLVRVPRLFTKMIERYKQLGGQIDKSLMYLHAGIINLRTFVALFDKPELSEPCSDTGLAAVRCFNWLAENTGERQYALLAKAISRTEKMQSVVATLKPQELLFG